MEKRILIVEDDDGLRSALHERLRAEGYSVETAADGASGEKMATGGGFDLVILDLMLPGKPGLDVCRDIRQRGINVPILILTARGETYEKVLGLKLGADDYVTKPFEAVELLARIEALLRRGGQSPSPLRSRVQFGNVQVNLARTEVLRDGIPVNLAAKEFQLLRYFLENRGRTVSREELLKKVWRMGIVSSTRTVDVHVACLRQKIEDHPRHPRWIQTVHGMGYRFSD
jgi:two-component system alkaline phosphatase synthesis response regulator PhoP